MSFVTRIIFFFLKCFSRRKMSELLTIYNFRERLRNLFRVEEIISQIVLDKIKEGHSIIIPE